MDKWLCSHEYYVGGIFLISITETVYGAAALSRVLNLSIYQILTRR